MAAQAIQPQVTQPPVSPVSVPELTPEVRLLLDLYSESNHLVLLCMEIDEKDIERKPVLGELREQCKVVGRLVRELDKLIRKKAEELRRQRAQAQVATPPLAPSPTM
jgi:hypothetical protein